MKKNWNGIARLVGAWVAGALLTGCSASGDKLNGPAGAFVAPKSVDASEATVVFFREGGVDHRVPLVLTNDRVVGSLLPDRYAATRVCAGALLAGAADRADTVGVPQYLPATARTGETLYFQVSNSPSGVFMVSPVPPEQARERLGSLRMASHIIDRHVPDCKPKTVVVAKADAPAVVAPIAATQVLQRVQLAADALFHFDKAGSNDMLPGGREAVDRLAMDIRKQAMHVQQLRVTGHTDRLGAAAYNLNLSKARADTVAARLRFAGIDLPIEVVGRGAQEPVTTHCVGQRATPELVACLQPDRRVAIELIGSVASGATQP